MGFGATTRSRLIVFAGLYFAQGVPWGLVTVAMAFRLTSLGLGAKEIGQITAVALLPWTFKFALGPLVDEISFGRWGRRRPWILGAELAAAITLLAVGSVDPREAPSLFLALVFVNSLFVAVQDVATDALAIGIVPEAERGRVTGVMSAGKWAGATAGGAGLAALAEVLGWPATYLLAAALLLTPAALVLSIDEGPAHTVRGLRPALRELGHELWTSVRLRVTWLAAVFALTAAASDSFLAPMIVPLMRRTLELTSGQATALVFVAGATSVVGSLLGGILADRLGRRRAIALGAITLAVSHLAFAAVHRSGATALAYQLAAGMAGGVLYTAILALFMDLTNPRVAATHFQVFMALIIVRMMLASWLGGRVAEATGATTMFVLGALLELAPLALLLFTDMDPRRAAESFRRANGEIR